MLARIIAIADRNVSVCLSVRHAPSPNSKRFLPNGGLKEGWGEKIQRFSRFKRQYLENGSRYGQSYY